MTQAAQKNQTETVEQQQPPAALSDFEKLLQGDLVRTTEYVPFLGKEALKLNPAIVIRYFCKPTREGFVCSDDMAMRFIMLCKARGLNPWEGDAYLVGYDSKDGPEFNLITAHQALIKRAEVHPDYDGIEFGIVVRHKETEQEKDIVGEIIPDECVLHGAWAIVHIKARKIPIHVRIALENFDKNRSVWNSNKPGMICKCARAAAFRLAFPNTLGGMYIDDEMPEATPSAPDGRMNLRADAKAPKATGAVAPPRTAPAATPPTGGTHEAAGAVPTGAAAQSSPVPETAPGAVTGGAGDRQESPAPASSGRPKSKAVKEEPAKPVEPADPRTNEQKAEEFSQIEVAELKSQLKTARVSSGRKKAWVNRALEMHNIAFIDDAGDEAIRAVAKQFKVFELENQ